MNKLIFLLLLLAPAAKANQITPSFTQGSMQSTTTTTQTINETVDQKVYGGEYNSWAGTNITPSADFTTFSLTDPAEPFQLETVSRSTTDVIETIDIDRTITTNSTTTSLSLFSQ
tara:strand:- start:32 stop:376 length:345 start_codon:yes stop_codon:yes gene_type:complete